MPSPGQRVSEYVLLEKLGEGGFGEVWKARHHVLNDLVAIKLPTDRTYVDQLRTEGMLQRTLQHPNIVRTIGLDAEHEPPYLVMELVDGVNLRAHLKQRGPLSHQDSLDIAKQVLEALSFAHGQGVVHRDLKPENVLLAPASSGVRHSVKITDFGLGRVTETVAASLYLSGRQSTNAISGTLDYMSPEQKKGAKADARSDVYSFGLMLYEMLTGELPVGAFRYPSELFPDLPKKIDDFLRRCLSPVAAERFASAEEALRAIEDDGTVEIGFRRGPAYALANGLEIFTLRELVEAILANPEEGRRALHDPQLEPWLRNIRERDLARLVSEFRSEEGDQDVEAQKFLEASGMVAPPKMDVDVAELKLGPIRRGTSHSFRLFATRIGRGILWGGAEVEGEPGWVTPSKQFFKGAECALDFTISTTGLKVGESYTVALVLESNGGKVRVPVHFSVAPRPAHLNLLTRELEIDSPGRRGGRAVVRVRNDGDEPLALSASWSDDWLSVEKCADLAPGAEEGVVVVARPASEDGQLGRVTLTSNGGSAEVLVRAKRVRSFNILSCLLGLVTGIVPFVAEIFFIFYCVDVLFRRRGTAEARDNLSFLLGLLPGVAAHLWWLVRP